MSRSSGVRRQFGMNEIVITGSTGVVGRRAVRELVASGRQVTGITRSERGRRLQTFAVGTEESEDLALQLELAPAARRIPHEHGRDERCVVQATFFSVPPPSAH